MTTHTPGPWMPDNRWPKCLVSFCEPGALSLRRVARIDYASEADARLIAAAPDLLTACKMVSDLDREAESLPYPVKVRFRLAIAAAEAAITKATESQKPQYYECGICSCWHPATWNGDCRDDANRYAADEIDAKHGTDGWESVEMPA